MSPAELTRGDSQGLTSDGNRPGFLQVQPAQCTVIDLRLFICISPFPAGVKSNRKEAEIFTGSALVTRGLA